MEMIVKPSATDTLPGIGVYAPSPTLTTVTVSCPHGGHVVMMAGDEGERVAVLLALTAHAALTACPCAAAVWGAYRGPSEPLDLTPFVDGMRPILEQNAAVADELRALFDPTE